MRRIAAATLLLLCSGCPSDPVPPPVPPPAPSPAPFDDPAPEPPSPEPAEPRVPRLSKQAIGGCGCSIYAPAGLKLDSPTQSDDGSDVYTGGVDVDGFHFGIICIKFAREQTADGDELENLLVSYLEHLQKSFDIVETIGVGRGHRLDSHPEARGVIDYWKGSNGEDWKVKGWVDSKHLGVVYIAGKGDYPIHNVQELYLDGFRFE